MPTIPEIPEAPTASGLDGIVVANTALSDVDGERGHLVIRGHAVEDLVARATFEDVCCLMWAGSLPLAAGREAMRTSLAGAREEAFARIDGIGDALDAGDGMEALRASVMSALALTPRSIACGLRARLASSPRRGRDDNRTGRSCRRHRRSATRPTSCA